MYFKKFLLILINPIELLRLILINFNKFLYFFNLGEFKRVNKELNKLKKKKKNKRAVIVGNGPSLNLKDLEKIKNADFFAFNKIYLALKETSWRPDYYLCEDYLVLSQNYEEIVNFLSKYPEITSFIAWYRRLNRCKRSNIFYFNYVTPKKNKYRFSTNPSKEIFCGYSVTYSALQLAIFLEYEEVLFIGMDFEFKTKESLNNEFLIGDETQNHFIKGYRKIGEKWNKPKLNEQEKAFQFAAKFLKENNSDVKVYNITRGGKFEFFPKKDLELFF